MTLDEQIKILESNAEFERKECDLQGCLNFRQLANWLKDYKQLLGAIEDIKEEIKELYNTPAMYIPNYDAYTQCIKTIDKHINGKEKV